MMDFEAQGGNEFDNADFAQAQGGNPSPVAGGRTRTVLTADGQGVVVLPDGVTLEDIQIQGRDLVVTGADGTLYVIEDGGVAVPQLEVDGVAVPPANLAALLLGNEPQPAAGPPQSSGGNFADDGGPLQDAFGLGDLLPYTELQFAADEEDEVIPDIVDRRPDVSIDPGDTGVSAVNAEDAVDEAGLPARGGEPAGSDSAANSEGTFGFINFSSPDGTSQVAINGVAVTQVGQTFSTPYGVLTITSIADGRIGYDYTLTDNTTDAAAEDLFTVTVTDADGDTATATLRISIIDDVPAAADDTDTVPAGSHAAIAGNVITGAGTDSGAAGADTLGADDARVSAVANSAGQSVTGSGALVIQGTYGTLTLNADGSYSYARAAGTPGGATDTFTYTLTDGDGDTDTATLTINIGDAPATVISVPEVGDGTVVDESGLPVRGGESPGSAEPTDVETTSGTITFAAPDGVASVAINGVVITGAGQQIQLPEGTLTIVAYDPVGGTLEYSFTLADNTGGDATQVDLTVTVTDTDGDSDSEDFVITVIDDTPTALDDVAAQGAEDAPVVVDAFANDVPGADSVDLVSGVSLVGGTLTGAGTVTYNNDGTFTYTPAPGEEGTVTFDYTITDGDGDTSTATVTITLAADSVPTIDVIEAQGGALVYEAGLPAGSDAAADSETTTGTFAITTGGDAVGSLMVNGVDLTNGGTVAGAHGTLTVTVSGGAYTYSYTLTTNTGGDATQDVFDVTVTDSDGDSANAPLVIDIVDDVPTAADDAASPAENTPVVIDVFANDVAGADGVDLAAGVALATGPAKGAVVYNGDGTFTYTPTPGEEGSDSFTYTITDGDGDTSTATVTITLSGDSTPTIDVVEARGGAVVNEAGLPAGSDAAADSETTAGTFAITTGNDTVGSLVIDGVDVTSGGTVTGAYGTLTVTVSGGAYSYSYTLTTNTGGDATQDVFDVVVTDSDGDSASAPLVIDIVDDVPTARADVDSVTEDAAPVADGNVLTGNGGADANATDGVADTQGADGAAVTTTGSFPGQHGTLVLNADGSYTYTLNTADPAVQGLSAGETLTEVFAYTIQDGDGDTSSATLTITINGSDDGVTINGLDAAGAEEVVYEDDLADGSSPDAAALTQTGTFGISSPDGLDDVTIGGTQVVTNGVFTAGLTASSALGTVTITGFTPVLGPDGSIIGGTFSYSYTLGDNTLTHSGAGKDGVTDSFAVAVTDTDGSSAGASLDVRVIDDVPTAQADTNSVAEGGVVAGNVLGNDEFGADGAAPGGAATGVAAGSDTSTAITGGLGGVIAGTYGTLTLNANGSYTYTGTPNTVPPAGATDTFVYTITDGDGDTSTVTLKIDLTDSGPPLAASNEDATVDEAALAIGSNPLSDAETVTGTLADNVSGGTGPYTFALVGGGGGNHGTLTLNANGSWSYTLATPVDGATADNSTNTVNNAETFTYRVTDGNGTTTTHTLTIDIIDDVPTAVDNGSAAAPIAVAEDTAAVIDVLGNDVGGADGVAVGAVALGTQATGGTAVYNGDGTFTYTPNPGFAGADSFTYTITDGDGDTSTATVYVNVAADSVPAPAAAVAAVDDDGLAGGNAGADGATDLDTDAGDAGAGLGDEAVFVGTFTADFGNDGPHASEAFTLAGMDGLGGAVGAETVAYSWDGTTNTLTATVDGGPRDNTALFTVAVNPVTGQYTVTLLASVAHAAGGAENDATAVLTFTATDDEGDEMGGTLTITFDDDVPTAVADSDSIAVGTFGPATGDVLANDAIGADGGTITAVSGTGAGTVGGVTAGLYGTLTLNADGSYSYTRDPGAPGGVSDVFTYALTDGDGDSTTATLTIDIGNATPVVGANATVLLDDDALAGGIAGGTGDDADAANLVGTLSGSGGDGALAWAFQLTGAPTGFTYESDGAGGILIKQGGTTVVTVTLDAATGGYQATQVAPVKHAPGADENNQIFTLNYTVTDSDSDSAPGTLTINVDDDGPTAIAPVAISVDNTAGGNGTAHLDGDLDVDGNFGADGGKVLFTAETVAALQSQSLTSALQPLTYTISNGGQTLTATKPDASVVFTIEVQPPGSPDQYEVTISQPLDAISTIDFNAGGYDFVGGNNAWAGFVPQGQDVSKPGGVPLDDDSRDLLLTPIQGGNSQGTVNSNAHEGGISGGNSLGPTEAMRADFVIDLAGSPPSGNYSDPSARNHTFDGHYTVNGASATFTQINAGSPNGLPTVKITARDDSDADNLVTPQNEANLVGDGVLDTITGIAINYNGITAQITANGTYTVGGANFTVTFVGGEVTVAGVLAGTQLAAFTADGYNSIEFLNVSGTTFKIGDFGASTITNSPVDFTAPVFVQDGDGDTVAGGVLEITAEPPTTPPVVLDLDGDGVEFVGLSAGVAFDYDGDGAATSTAWAGADDGLLVHDGNGNRAADDGSEIVFGGNGLTDLEGLAAKYDSNHDGVLDARDAEFASFGVWQDANGNGVTDEGEFATLAEAGIASITLVSDGKAYGAAGGDVHVHGTTTYSRADGSIGLAADAEFATGAEQKAAQRTAETVATAAAAGALLMPEPVLAHDQVATADEPLRQIDAGLLELEKQDPAGLADGPALPEASDLLGAEERPRPDAGERSAEHSSEDHAPAALVAEAEGGRRADGPDTASEPVADLGGSAFAGFAGDASGGAIMDALLALQATPAQPPATVDPAVAEVLSEVAGGAAVDAIVDHYAGGEGAGPAGAGGEIDSAALLQALDGHVYLAGNGAVIPDAMDDAALLAAAVSA